MILITGANGFLGSALVHSLKEKNDLRLSVRNFNSIFQQDEFDVVLGELSPSQNWCAALYDIDVVIHCASRVHIMNQSNYSSELNEFRIVNCFSTLNLARQSAAAGVKRFVFISSIGVNGDITFEHPFVVSDAVRPCSAYAFSKYEAELGLRQISLETGMELVVIRPPFVYGPNAPGNFSVLVKYLNSGLPLPCASLSNLRSFIALENLVDLIETCLCHPSAANNTFLASDNDDISTADFIKRVASSFGRYPLMIPVPYPIIYTFAKFFNRNDFMQKFYRSLQVNIDKTRSLLDWDPKVSMHMALENAAKTWK